MRARVLPPFGPCPHTMTLRAALQSIYGDHAILPWDRNIFSADDNAREARVRSGERGTIRYEVTVTYALPCPPR